MFAKVFGLVGRGERVKRHKGPRHAKTCLRAYVDSKGQDQPAHARSLIRAFVIR